jgi:hypothetical protein
MYIYIKEARDFSPPISYCTSRNHERTSLSEIMHMLLSPLIYPKHIYSVTSHFYSLNSAPDFYRKILEKGWVGREGIQDLLLLACMHAIVNLQYCTTRKHALNRP